MKNWSVTKLLFLTFSILLSIGIYFLPLILSGKIGKSYLENALHVKLGGEWKVENISLSWLGPQKVSTVNGERDKFHFEGKDLEIYSPLINLNRSLKWPFPPQVEMKTGHIIFEKELILNEITVNSTNDQKKVIRAKGKNGSLILEALLEPKLHYHLAIDQMPAILLDLYKTKYPISIFTGPLFSCIIDGTDIDTNIQFSSENLQFTTKFKKDANLLTLTSPFEGRFILSNYLSRQLFNDSSIRPVSAEAITWSLAAGSNIDSMQLDTLNIPSGYLNLGRMHFLNMNTLSDILSILKAHFRQNANIPIWFQSMPIKIEDGVCHITRSELLIDRTYEIATWGEINLLKETVNLGLALTAQTLSAAFNMNFLPKDYLVPMFIDGSFDNIDFHKSRALRTLGKLFLIQQSPFYTKELLPDPKISVAPKREPLPWE